MYIQEFWDTFKIKYMVGQGKSKITISLFAFKVLRLQTDTYNLPPHMILCNSHGSNKNHNFYLSIYYGQQIIHIYYNNHTTFTNIL